ncbi:MAG: phytanoyl-CoA dioxygenase family protein [Armatimonadota bacterium]
MTQGERIEVPTALSQEQVRFFVDNGFLAAEGLVTPEEIEELKRDAAFIARGGYPSETLVPLPSDLTDDEVLRQILCIHHPYYVSPVMKRYALHPRICGALSQIVGAHLAHWDGNIKCMHSMLFIKPPQFQGRAWHQDETYIPTRDRTLTGAWIALDDATSENGGLWVIPGSHRAGYLYPERPETDPDEFDHADEAYGFDESTKVPVEVKAGTVVFFNGYLLHMSYKNRSDVYRRVLVNHYMSSSSLLPWSFKDGPTVAKADRRTVLHAAGVDPYAWKGYAEPEGGPSLRTCKATDDISKAVSTQS